MKNDGLKALMGLLKKAEGEQMPAGQAPAGQAPAGQAPAGQAPAGQAPAGQAPAEQAPTVEELSQEILALETQINDLEAKKQEILDYVAPETKAASLAIIHEVFPDAGTAQIVKAAQASLLEILSQGRGGY